MTLPFADVVVAARTGGSRAGVLPVSALARALAAATPVAREHAALLLARLAAGVAVDTLTARELELEIAGMSDEARSLVEVVAPTLAPPDIAAVVQRALIGITAAMSGVIGARVPLAVAVDATVLQACRECRWGRDRLTEKDRPRELVRRLARALSLPVIDNKGVESAEVSAKKLAALDGEASAADARRRAIEQQVRSRLPQD